MWFRVVVAAIINALTLPFLASDQAAKLLVTHLPGQMVAEVAQPIGLGLFTLVVVGWAMLPLRRVSLLDRLPQGLYWFRPGDGRIVAANAFLPRLLRRPVTHHDEVMATIGVTPEDQRLLLLSVRGGGAPMELRVQPRRCPSCGRAVPAVQASVEVSDEQEIRCRCGTVYPATERRLYELTALPSGAGTVAVSIRDVTGSSMHAAVSRLLPLLSAVFTTSQACLSFVDEVNHCLEHSLTYYRQAVKSHRVHGDDRLLTKKRLAELYASARTMLGRGWDPDNQVPQITGELAAAQHQIRAAVEQYNRSAPPHLQLGLRRAA